MIFSKRKKAQTERLLLDVLNSQECDVVVVRGNECQVLFMNESAQSHIVPAETQPTDCKTSYLALFPSLCKNCPHLQTKYVEGPHHFDVPDSEGHIYSVTANNIRWWDEEPATILYFRNVDSERNIQNKFYNLAYVDQLTGVPNRQRFREDFDAISVNIKNNKLCGIVAMFDLDNFKSINDTYGHNTGDVMLKRLTQFFKDDPDLNGHLYRLGGDEFVLFFHDDVGRFATHQEFEDHYHSLLKRALRSYTMPNIELYCTISVGVAFFPIHGVNASELLRKADIALYKAKAAGRNRILFFVDQYDTAKKFKDLFINIQPILTSFGHTYGYEMIDGGNEEFRGRNSVNLTNLDRTIDALGMTDIENDSRYFITCTDQLMNASVLRNLPKDKFIIQIHLDEVKDKNDYEIYRRLHSHGYSLAFSGIPASQITPETLELASYIKFAPAQGEEAEQKKIIAANPGKRFIAANVNTSTEFEVASHLGFKLFQGFFFNEPSVVRKTKDIDPLKVNYFRLLKLTSTNDYVDFPEIGNVISSDVALSYKLLRLLNSAAVGLRNKISSIDVALAYLGEENLKKWIALLALRGVASDKPLELIRMSLIRAQFGELLAPHLTPQRDTKHVFMVGLFSLLHIALEKSKEELFEEIPVADDIRNSLLTEDGVYSDLVAFFSSYEYATWDEVTHFAEENKVSDQLINNCYISAVKWYNTLTDS